MFEWALKLIDLDLAYVCHQRAEDLKGFNPPPSPYRERPIEESRRLFMDMKNGKVCDVFLLFHLRNLDLPQSWQLHIVNWSEILLNIYRQRKRKKSIAANLVHTFFFISGSDRF